MPASFIDDIDVGDLPDVELGGQDRLDSDIFKHANVMPSEGVELLIRHDYFFKGKAFFLVGFAKVEDDRFLRLPGVIQNPLV